MLEKLDVTGCERWQKHGFNRIYIQNRQGATVFYDVNDKTWHIHGDFEEADVKASVYTLMEVSSDEELQKAV